MPNVSRRTRVRLPSLSSATSSPAIRIEPSNPPSSSPTACSRVDLPEPDGPSKATISPWRTSRSTPRSTSIVTSPCRKLRLRPLTVSTSFIAKHLHRIGARRLPRRIERGEEAQHQRHGDDGEHLERIGLGRQLGQEADRGILQILDGEELDQVHEGLAEIEEKEAEAEPGEDPDRADDEADRHEHLHQPAPAGAHGSKDGDVAGLGS